MNALAVVRLVVVACALALSLTTPAVAMDADVIVVFRDGVSADSATAALERSQGFRATQRYAAALDGFAARLSDVQRERVRTDPTVAFLVPDTTFQGTALTPVVARESVPVGVRRVRAATTTQAHAAADVGVAVLDTGLDLPNGDLNARSATNCVTPGTAAQDDHGHGTHVAGTLAARNTGSGVIGIAPGTVLHAVKVLNAKKSGTLSQLLCGLDWVTRNAAALNLRVINLSVSGNGRSDGACGRTSGDVLHTAICSVTAAGVTVVASAGNNAVDLAGAVPAAYPEVLAVTAMTDTDGVPGARGPAACAKGEIDDRLWSFSNVAVSAADAARVVAGSGACVVSTKRGGGTTTMSGTSMAAPHVAGAVALCHGNGGVPGPCAGLTPAQVAQRLRADAEAAAAAGWGFIGDPLRPVPGKVLGPLVTAANY